jgi:murein tripeptide amidase MpaA
MCQRAGFIVLSIALALGAQAEPRRYDGYAVVRIAVDSAAQLDELTRLAADVWSEHAGLGPLDFMFAPGQLAELDARGIRYQVWIPDVQARIESERRATGRGWFDAYHTYDEITAYMNQLAAAHPALAQVVSIGKTLEDRDIWGLRIAAPTLPPHAPAVVYFGGEHAREWIGTTIPSYVATYLLDQYGVDPTVTELVNHVEWFLVPVFNVDGYVFTWTDDRMWRKNRRLNANNTYGVDINRNWSYGWGSDDGSSGLPSSASYRGPAPFSEPETCALRDFFISHPKVRALNDIHSYSQLILWPWGCTPTLCPDDATYSTVGIAMRQLILGVHNVPYTAGPTYTTIYPVSGDSCDWTYGERGIFSWSFELRDTGTYGFILPPEQIIPNNEEILPALLHLTNSAPVRATQMNFPENRPTQLIVGRPTPVRVVITSGVENVQVATAALHFRYHPQQDYTAVPMTPLPNGLFEAVLPATNCTSSPQYYFTVAADSGVYSSPAGAPELVYTAQMLSGTTVFAENLDTNPGWTTEGLWAWGTPLGGGGAHGKPDPRAGKSGAYVYGYNLSGDYTNSAPEYSLTTPPISCARQYGLRMSFWRWLGVERAPYDRARVYARHDGGNWVTLWENPTAETADNLWIYQDFDISATADNQAAVYIRWSLGPTDSGWAYCGWNIDDVRVYATACAERLGDVDCDGLLGFSDINPFVQLLVDPSGWSQQRPWCPALNGDTSGDGVVNFGDINPFVTLLTSQ